LDSRLKDAESSLTKCELADKVRRQEEQLEGGERVIKREYDRVEKLAREWEARA